jgi:Fe-S-cluster-containing dehydrogenase component/formate-dependent nitrite reductase membrane component NrfD
MRYGFVIDQDRCIGCHACTVACKEEHQVPLGVFRTWVKYIEKGEFPHTSRHFGVMRCNHCDDAPCSTICPTNALYRRSDGIIDFDNQRCIGCKSCMQACPYDALYIDPNNNTAAKCNFCAHRVEAKLEPACVIVCPTQAILAGDLDDPASNVSRTVATQKVYVRKPHKGTQPKLFYVGIEGDLLEPGRLSRQNGYAFAEQHGQRASGPTFDPALTREVYDVAHPSTWGWKIAAYLWTKSIAAGVMLVAGAMLWMMSRHFGGPIVSVASPLIALAALGLTGLLLVFDLKRPDRFFYLLTKPNFRSWLVIGAYILLAFGALCVAWLICGFLYDGVPTALIIATPLFAAATACYSAFLFAQAKGRDLWQSPMFFWHLLVQSFVAGSAVYLLATLGYHSRLMAMATPHSSWAINGFLLQRAFGFLQVSLLLGLCMTIAEQLLPHASEDAKSASRTLTRGLLRARFWGLAIGAGMVVPTFILGCVRYLPFRPATESGFVAATVAAAVLALAGVWWFEDVWIKAGQSVPLS